MAFLRNLLSISTSPLKLQMYSPLGEYSIVQRKASMQRDVQKSEMSLSHDPIKLSIDQSDVSASLGYYNQTKLRQKKVSDSKQAVLKVIGEICQDGDQMMKTQGNAYSGICYRKFTRGEYRLQQIFMPVRPSITWNGSGTTKVDFTPYNQNISWEVHTKADIEYQRRNPDISVAQWNKVDIAYNGTPADVTKIGVEGAKKMSVWM